MSLKRSYKKPTYANPRYSKRFNRASKPNSLRSKVFEFMRDYPLASFQQMFNFLLQDWKHKIHDIDDFNNVLYVYRCQYIQIHGKRAIPDKKQLEAIRKGYEISLYKTEFTPDPEVVASKIIEDETKEIERVKAITIALQSRRY